MNNLTTASKKRILKLIGLKKYLHTKKPLIELHKLIQELQKLQYCEIFNYDNFFLIMKAFTFIKTGKRNSCFTQSLQKKDRENINNILQMIEIKFFSNQNIKLDIQKLINMQIFDQYNVERMYFYYLFFIHDLKKYFIS